ncbi:MAG: J domain-containing protein [Acidimicrobiia bacterium]|nr:J domain-containing protein [Acidimicrobiia bacterium]
MSKTYYELLEVAPSASVDDIKRAFRREIAKYHPDKVAHLGKEFQDIAAVRAAELTEAYKTLTDETQRAEYDEVISSGGPAAPTSAPVAAPPPRPAAPRHAEPAPPSGSSIFQHERSASGDLVLKFARERFKSALASEFGQYDDLRLQGFEVSAVPKPAFFSMKSPPRVFGRIVPVVDAAAVAEAWTLAARSPKDKQRDLCLFLMGPSVAPPGELAAAINEERRKPMLAGGKIFLVPVNTKTWAAHVPADAPPVVKSLLARLKPA